MGLLQSKNVFQLPVELQSPHPRSVGSGHEESKRQKQVNTVPQEFRVADNSAMSEETSGLLSTE